MLPDPVGVALRHLPADNLLVQRARGRWQRGRGGRGVRRRRLPRGGVVELRMNYPYERDVWLTPEQMDDVHAVMDLLGPGETFVDVGANIGLWTIAAAMRVGPAGRVIAAEPGEIMQRLARNVALNGFADRVELHHAALGSTPGTASFDQGGKFHNIGRISAGGSSTVVVGTLDDLLIDAEPRVVKIDVEGLELDVLRGGEDLLRRTQPAIVVEFTPSECHGSLAAWPVHRWLDARGWRATRLPSDFAPGDGHRNLLYLAEGPTRQDVG